MPQTLRSTVFVIFFFLWSFCWGSLLLPLSLLWNSVGVWTAKVWGIGLMQALNMLCNLRYEIRRTQHQSETPVIYAMKHQSAWDTTIIYMLLGDVAVILKKGLIYVPIIGLYFIALRVIPINRSLGSQTLKDMIRAARKEVRDNGRSIFIFPEGHRIDVNAEPHYQPGIAALYKDLNIPVVPIAVNSGFFWKRRGLHKKPGKIILEFLPSIEPGLDRKEFMETLVDRIETKTRALVLEAQSCS